MMTNQLLTNVMKYYPYYWQEAYHIVEHFLKEHAPTKVDVLHSKITFDYDMYWSIERQEIWKAIEFVAEHLKRCEEFGYPFLQATIDSSIKNALNWNNHNVVVCPGHEPPMWVPLDEPPFEFKDHLVRHAIERHGLHNFIYTVGVAKEAMLDWDGRFYKVLDSLERQDFDPVYNILSAAERMDLATCISGNCQFLVSYPKNHRAFFAKETLIKCIRESLGVPQKPFFKTIG